MKPCHCTATSLEQLNFKSVTGFLLKMLQLFCFVDPLKTNAKYRITFDYIAKAFRLRYTEGKKNYNMIDKNLEKKRNMAP